MWPFVSDCFYLAIFLRFHYIVAFIGTSFLFIVKYSIICTYHTLFIHSSVDRHFGLFLPLAIMNSAIVNIHIQIFV
jgi:hypothetical protein